MLSEAEIVGELGHKHGRGKISYANYEYKNQVILVVPNPINV
jgi:hypothetical protein